MEDPVEEEIAYVALGSNLGAREQHLAGALDALRAVAGVRELAVSSVYETAPIGPGEQDFYLNAVARLTTSLAPRALLEQLLAIEATAGRRRGPERNAPRTLDLDLLLYGEHAIDEPGLEVPHPRMCDRGFVLEPLCELAPDLVVPGRTDTVEALARRVRDATCVRRRGP
ncbi:MAG: 2-amino-4-hydroxy-6-hydroxymethyldihydropteridine diphosphokinase [Myxococcales bacterium]|nr:2-amino-4-hydroxy-6-hydroxymethyldihydropteridine diphosphokinase [Myxococcales bacterium]